MSPVIASRLLILLFFVNELIVVVRSKPEERQSLNVPLYTSLSLLLLLVPFFYVLPLPAWLGWGIVALQAAGLLLEVFSEIQLARAKSFAVSSDAATTVQRSGMYRLFENPIYLGILIQLLAWSLWMPLLLLTMILVLPVVRSMVANERQFLATRHNTSHRGVDSFLWN
jgi:protein-S-isoprenylcysteine O-methyltransferase Ste14